MTHDVVYILPNEMPNTAELCYSLRSVEANFPYYRVVFAGGCPDGFRPDLWLDIRQRGEDKWEKVNGTIVDACSCDYLTDRIWLFNDDFFIMRAFTGGEACTRGTLKEHIDRIEAPAGAFDYSIKLRDVLRQLRAQNLPTLDYETHTPMLIDRAAANRVLPTFKGCPMFRSLYGNATRAPHSPITDVKICDRDGLPPEDAEVVSTLDAAFLMGAVGRYIRARFPEPSRFEQ